MDVNEFNKLKNRAAEILKNTSYNAKEENYDVNSLIEELNTFRIELELQNEELRNSNLNLIRERERYYSLFDNTPAGNIILDSDYNIYEINKSAAKILQSSRLELVGKSFTNFIHNQSQDLFYLSLVDLEENNYLHDFELQIKGAIGKRIFTSASVIKFIDENQKILFRLSLIDNTDKKAVEKKLNESVNLYESLVSSISLILFRVDSESNIVYANDVFTKFFNLDKNDIIGKHVSYAFPPRLANTILSDNLLCKSMDDSLTVIEEFSGVNDNHNYLQVVRTPIHDLDGNISGIQIVMWDITEMKQAESILKNSEYKYRKLVEDSSDLFVISDGEGNISYVGENCYQITGFTSYEALNIKIYDQMHPDDKENIRVAYKKSFENTSETNTTLGRFKHKNGHWVWFELAITNMTQDPVINGIITNVRDVTKRIESDNLIHEAEERYRFLFNFLPDGIVLIDPETSRAIDFNQAAYKDLGYTAEEFANLNINDYDAIETPEITKERIENIMNYGEDEFESIHRKKDGTLRAVLVKVQIIEYKSKKYILALYRDLTSYKQNLKDKEDSDLKFRTLVDSAFDGIYLLNEREYIYANESFCNITGYTHDEIVSNEFDITDLLTPNSKEFFEERYKKRQAGENISNKYEMQIITKSGELKCIEISTATIGTGEKSIIGIVRDITANKKAESEIRNAKESAERAAEIANTILNNLGHELRTPLNGMLGFTKLLKAEITDPDHVEMMRMVEMSGERLKKTLSALFVLTELDSLKYDLMFDLCELNTFISMYDKTTIEMIQDKPIEFELQLSDKQIEFMTDEYLLHQAIYEILDNAYKFTESGKVSIQVDKRLISSKEKAIIEITDSGIGIDLDRMTHIFEPFRQGSEGIQRKHEGMGLGLTIVKKIVEKLNGYYEIDSSINEGTTVRLIFDCN